jgi:hypothetical protein
MTDEEWKSLQAHMPKTPTTPPRPPATEFSQRQAAQINLRRATGSLLNPNVTNWNAAGLFPQQNTETLPYSGSQAPEQGREVAGLNQALAARQQQSLNPGLRAISPMPNPGPPPPSDLDYAKARNAAWQSQGGMLNSPSSADTIR